MSDSSDHSGRPKRTAAAGRWDPGPGCRSYSFVAKRDRSWFEGIEPEIADTMMATGCSESEAMKLWMSPEWN